MLTPIAIRPAAITGSAGTTTREAAAARARPTRACATKVNATSVHSDRDEIFDAGPASPPVAEAGLVAPAPGVDGACVAASAATGPLDAGEPVAG